MGLLPDSDGLCANAEHGTHDLRIRAYGLCFNYELGGLSRPDAKTLTDKAFAYVRCLRIKTPIPTASILLKQSDPYLAKELEALQACKAAGREREAGESKVHHSLAVFV